MESHNEQWLGLEAIINEKYNIAGITIRHLAPLKKKFAMKQVFKNAGLPVARGEYVMDLNQTLQLADSLGYPLILKPDEGVGAGGIYRVENESELKSCLSRIRSDYLIEEFIEAGIVTYDGLTDYEGNVIFENSLIYGDGVLEYLLGKDTFFYVSRHIADNLRTVGQSSYRSVIFAENFFILSFSKSAKPICPLKSIAGLRVGPFWT